MRILSRAVLMVALTVSAWAERPALSGIVLDESGDPIEGAAVRISTAAVKHGYNTLCPSCYLDCGKQAKTGAGGSFAIPNVDPELKFTVIVVHEGFLTAVQKDLDPLAKPAELKLSKLPSERMQPGHFLKGVLLDSDGNSITGAVIETFGRSTERGFCFGQCGGGVDPLAISNDKGGFLITAEEPNLKIAFKVDATGYTQGSECSVNIVQEEDYGN